MKNERFIGPVPELSIVNTDTHLSTYVWPQEYDFFDFQVYRTLYEML